MRPSTLATLLVVLAVNLRAWMEYEPSRAIGGEPGRALAFVFGPRISIGNLGADF
jgi:hypothetical protein